MASSIQKYIKNISAESITVEGQTILAGAYYLIQATEEAKFSSSDTLLSELASGRLLMAKTNDGTKDIFSLNEAVSYLRQLVILGPTVLSAEASQVLLSTTEVDLPKASDPRAEIYNYLGCARLHGFSLIFNSSKVTVQMLIDSNTIFDIDCNDLNEFASSSEHQLTRTPWLYWDKSTKQLHFRPSSPIQARTAISIRCRANSNSSNRDLEGYIIDIEGLD